MSLRPGVDANTAARAMTPLGATAAAARFDAATLAPTAMARLRLVLAAGREAEADTAGVGPRAMLRQWIEERFPKPLRELTDDDIDKIAAKVAKVRPFVSAKELANAKAKLKGLRDAFRANAATKGTGSFAGRRLGGYGSVELADLDAVDTGESLCIHGSDQDKKDCERVREVGWIVYFLSFFWPF